MKKTKNIAATADGFKPILNNDPNRLRKHILQDVHFFIDKMAFPGEVSPFEEEEIAEDAWVHVIENRHKYDPTRGASFKTWAKKVAENFTLDELEKLGRNPLHKAIGFPEDRPQDEDDSKSYAEKVCYYRTYGYDNDYLDRMQAKGALDTLNAKLAGYDEWDRAVAEMLVDERPKAEIMARTKMSSGNIDIRKFRLLKKMRTDMYRAGYSLCA